MDFGQPPAGSFEIDIGDFEIASYTRNGFLAVERITTDEELEWLRTVYDAVLKIPPTGFLDGIFDLSAPYGTTEMPKLGQLLLPEKLVPQIRDTLMYRNAKRISSRLLEQSEPDVQSWGHLIFKAPLTGGITPWHQDEAYWEVSQDYNALGSWLALDDVDTNNGCLWFVPGSHKGEVLPHRHRGNDPSVHVLEFDIDVDTERGVPAPLKAGGMTFHHARTWHYAGPNSTKRIRRAWANEFQTQPVKREAPADRPWLVEGREAHAKSYVPQDREALR